MTDNKIETDEAGVPEYMDLQGLIFQNADARQYYNELPKNIRDQLEPHSGGINTFEVLQSYVEEAKIDGK